MDNLYIEPTKSSPQIDFNADTNILTMIGESYPENTIKFYVPIIDWLEKFTNSISNQSVEVNIELIYFNSSSSQILINLFDLLEQAQQKGNHITINWIFDKDNDSALESGEDFQEELSHITFNLVEK
ncbi:MAG: DUF1987 domain-containing protein [Gammaproteobacteria bacterium]|nr:DUF1987 domain-containing protein [Gammaproteobacteria bacterium]